MKTIFYRFWRQFRQFLKKVHLKYIQLMWDHTIDTPFIPEQIKKVALFRWDDKLGDGIMSGILVGQLRKFRPDIEITMICRQTTPKWFTFDPKLKWIISDRKSIAEAKSLKKYEHQFDLVIELAEKLDYKIIIALSTLKAKHYLGYHQIHYRLFDLNLDSHIIHMAHRYLAAAQLLLPSECLATRTIPYPNFEQQQTQLQQYLNNTEETSINRIAVNLFGAGKYKKFDLTQAIAFLSRWRKTFPCDQLILMPAPDQDDFLAKLVVELSDPFVKLSPLAVGLTESLALINVTDFTFTPDTAVVHMTSALNKPVLAIYRPPNQWCYDEWTPLAEGSESLFTLIPKSKYDRIYIHQFDWHEFVNARANILEFLLKNKSKCPPAKLS